jgi:hypothetical protein
MQADTYSPHATRIETTRVTVHDTHDKTSGPFTRATNPTHQVTPVGHHMSNESNRTSYHIIHQVTPVGHHMSNESNRTSEPPRRPIPAPWCPAEPAATDPRARQPFRMAHSFALH